MTLTYKNSVSRALTRIDGSVPFTELVDQAWQQGLTEPDPRDDLSGKDVTAQAGDSGAKRLQH